MAQIHTSSDLFYLFIFDIKYCHGLVVTNELCRLDKAVECVPVMAETKC